MSQFTRRHWLQSAGAGLATLSANSYLKAAGANERVRVAVIGTGGHGSSHVDAWRATPHAELVYICDVDENCRGNHTAKDSSLKPVADLRKVLDDKSIDAVSIATPDHWHAPAALLALEAGKHVYVEKPCAHNLREAKLLAEAARQSGRQVQHGTQARSNPFVVAAIKLLQDGIIGNVLIAKAWNVQARRNIGREQPTTPPATLDYDLWLGPAPEVPFQANRFHHKWRWWYDFGTGDAGNDGVHDLDIARWGLGVSGLPSRISAIGGKYVFDDDQQFPDTMTAAFEYSPEAAGGRRKQLVFEMRIWTRVSPYNVDNGCEFFGTGGRMLLGKNGKFVVTGNDKQPISLPDKLPESTLGALGYHFGNFLDAIRDGKPLNAPIQEGYESTALSHLGNVATRLGRSITLDQQKVAIENDAEANALLSRQYRTGHWSVPKGII
jgi:predicted dehydrogenase